MLKECDDDTTVVARVAGFTRLLDERVHEKEDQDDDDEG